MFQFRAAFFICALFAFAASQDESNGDVRLEGDTDTRGRVEVYLEGEGMNEWTTLCFNYMDVKSQEGVAQAVCRQLGFYDFKALGNVTAFGLPNATHMAEKLEVADCLAKSDPRNAPQHILRCLPSMGDCSEGDDFAVECDDQSRGSYPYDTMVNFWVDDQLEGSVSSGFASVYLNKEWGPVCNMDQWDADIFCKQLSYTNAIDVELMNSTVDGKPVLDEFQCSDISDSYCLRDCFRYPKKTQEISCPGGFSYVTCTFKDGLDEGELEDYGTRSSCTSSSSSKAGTIAGAVVGSVLGVLLIVIVIVALGCYCSGGKKGSYSPAGGASKTKYDAI